ncbi:MAG: sigma-70 family RNA polymerase sigma factor [Burkholderiaceae bacterium]
MDAPLTFRRQLLDTIPRLRRYARSLVFDSHAADDLVQTTLERALAHWHQFDQRRDIVLWTVSIAHNAFMDDRRRQARVPLSEAYDEYADQLPAPGVDIGLRIDLIAALRRLPTEQREPLLLVTLEQLSYADCAETLGIPIGTVMSRVSRARAALRELLEGKPPRSTGGLRRVV